MSKVPRRIPFEELAANVADVFDRVASEHESVLVERDGKAIAIVTPVAPVGPRRRRKGVTTEQAHTSRFRFTLESAAGSVPPLRASLDWQEVERRVKEEHVERVVREMHTQ